jgi:hypothetical protein
MSTATKSIVLLSVVLRPLCTLFAQDAPKANPSVSGSNGKLPAVLHFCAQHCATFTLENGHYVRTAGGANNGSLTVMTVEKFTPDLVTIHRTDTGRFPGTAEYSGRPSDNGNTLSGNGWKITWGAALNTIPGSDEERAQRAQQAAGAQTARTPIKPPVRMPQMSEPTAAMATIKLDLSGDWQGYYDGPAFVKFIRITVNGNNITSQALNDNLQPTGRPFFRGVYSSPASHLQVEIPAIGSLREAITGQPDRWEAAELTIGDPDHFRIGKHPPFERMSAPKVGDVPCDPGNRFHTGGLWAFFRARLQLKAKDYDQAFCWYFVGAEQGDRSSLAGLGYMYHHGFGVQEDDAMAMRLYMTSAEKGNPEGAHGVSVLYELGHGVPKDPAKAELWRSKEAQLRADLKAQKRAEELADQQREEAMEVIGLLGRVAVSTIASAGLESPLCSKPTSERDAQHKRDILKSEGLRCEGGMLRPTEK